MTKFTPDDLKKQWPVKYDLWKFIQKNNGEWYGICKNQGGSITNKINKNGNEIPVLEAHELAETGQLSYGILAQSFKNTFEAKKIKCDCGITFTIEESQTHCNYCGIKISDIGKKKSVDLSVRKKTGLFSRKTDEQAAQEIFEKYGK